MECEIRLTFVIDFKRTIFYLICLHEINLNLSDQYFHPMSQYIICKYIISLRKSLFFFLSERQIILSKFSLPLGKFAPF